MYWLPPIKRNPSLSAKCARERERAKEWKRSNKTDKGGRNSMTIGLAARNNFNLEYCFLCKSWHIQHTTEKYAFHLANKKKQQHLWTSPWFIHSRVAFCDFAFTRVPSIYSLGRLCHSPQYFAYGSLRCRHTHIFLEHSRNFSPFTWIRKRVHRQTVRRQLSLEPWESTKMSVEMGFQHWANILAQYVVFAHMTHKIVFYTIQTTISAWMACFGSAAIAVNSQCCHYN